MNELYYIYFMVSKTPTRFGGLIRKVGKSKYNHSSIGLDEELKELYGFARTQHNIIFLGGLMLENMDRYTLRKSDYVDVVIFKVPVTLEQYTWVKETVNRVHHDEEYMYNLFSVLSYPITHGFETYKAYTCVEFVMHILEYLGYQPPYPAYRCKPDDLLILLKDYIFYQGNLLDYCKRDDFDNDYFAPMNFLILKKNILSFAEITRRSLFKRGQ